MTWWEEQGLVAAQLGGVEILIEDIVDRIGRRVVAPLLPGVDRRPPSIDLGRTEAPWQVSAYVTGDYLPTYRRLRALFDQPGPYSFSHPYLGDYSVDLPDGVEIRQAMAQGGIAFLTFTAIPASDVLPFSEPIASPRDRVRLKALGAVALLEDGFRKRYSGAPFLDLLDLAEGWVGDMASRIDDAARRARAYASPVTDITSALQDLRASARTLASLPGELARTIGGLLEQIFAALPQPTDDTADARAARASALDALTALTSWTPYPEAEREGLRSPRVEESAAAFAALLGGLGIARAQLALKDIPLESTAEAAAISSVMSSGCELYLAGPGLDESTEQALQDLRTGWATYVLSTTLPQVTTLVLPADRAGIAVAMELFGDPTRAEEIADMNDVLESSFLPGGRALTVLTA